MFPAKRKREAEKHREYLQGNRLSLWRAEEKDREIDGEVKQGLDLKLKEVLSYATLRKTGEGSLSGEDGGSKTCSSRGTFSNNDCAKDAAWRVALRKEWGVRRTRRHTSPSKAGWKGEKAYERVSS